MWEGKTKPIGISIALSMIVLASMILPCFATENWVVNGVWYWGKWELGRARYDNGIGCRNLADQQIETFDLFQTIRVCSWCKLTTYINQVGDPDPDNFWGEIRAKIRGRIEWTGLCGWQTEWHWAKTIEKNWFIYKYDHDDPDKPLFADDMDWQWLGNWENLDWVFDADGYDYPPSWVYNNPDVEILTLEYDFHYDFLGTPLVYDLYNAHVNRDAYPTITIEWSGNE